MVSIGAYKYWRDNLNSNVSSTLLIESASFVYWRKQMGKRYQGRGGGGRGRGGSRASTNQKGLTGESASAANYQAPNVGYEDQVFSHGTTKVAATFTVVLTKLCSDTILASLVSTAVNVAAAFVVSCEKTWSSHPTVGAR